jgi:hypothetical protein
VNDRPTQPPLALLRYADPDWLDAVRRGLNLIMAAVGLFVALICVVAAMRDKPPETIGAAVTGAVAVAALIAYVIYLAGAWLLVRPEPRPVAGADPHRTLRSVIRISLLVGLVRQLQEVVVTQLSIEDTIKTLFAVFSIISALFAFAGQIALLRYLRALALRIPDRALADRGLTIICGTAICYGGLLIAVALLALVLATAGPRRPDVSGIRMTIVGMGVGLLVCLVALILLLEKLRNRLAEQAAHARRTRATTTATTAAPPIDAPGRH